MRPTVKSWDGEWTTLVITTVGADPRTRAALRATLQQTRFAELREGVWMRPDNLDLVLPQDITVRARVLRATDEAPVELARTLWDLDSWVRVAHELLDDMSQASETASRFVAAAGMVRHLLTDPVLPAELLPASWPGNELRDSYFRFADELAKRRDHNRPAELVEAAT